PWVCPSDRARRPFAGDQFHGSQTPLQTSQFAKFHPKSRIASAQRLRAARYRQCGLNPDDGQIGLPPSRIHATLRLSHGMERIMTRKAFGLAGIAAALFAAPAVAHHAFAMFDQSKVLYMSGTVKQFEFVNPHAWLHVTIVNGKGDTST